MYNVLLTALLVLSVIIVIAIFMQPQKNPSSNVFDNSGSEALFERTKARGFEAIYATFYSSSSFLLASNCSSVSNLIK